MVIARGLDSMPFDFAAASWRQCPPGLVQSPPFE